MRSVLFALSFFFFACQQKQTKQTIIPVPLGTDQSITEQIQYASVGKTRLSDYGFFEGRLADLKPSEQVMPYELNTPLFSDYALKKRFIYLPKGEKIGYQEKNVLDFPVGTVLIKNFYYSARQLGNIADKILETRLLIHERDGWKALPYIWNTQQTEAYLEITGGLLPTSLQNKGVVHYTVPDMNQCKSCHDKSGTMTPIGPTVRQLNRKAVASDTNQMLLLADKGWIGLPDHTLPQLAVWNDPASGSLNERARAYLDINCAHCHNDQGPAKNSGLNLTYFETDPYRLGVNKKPVAAGRGSGNLKYGIVPKKPGGSILIHRMQTTEPGTMMPELGRSLPHDEGIALIREWIEKM
ncbi:hypothetical protein N7E81_16350 [Reichenbachiella carrageenanivorans]|uniref:Cytochrome c domain-containing protein n=1 Tax=Reichenbachiella carrageenanivorans TaxID=2979869 RepID=A0ABY6D1I5_9BACT|nr:SO2930 family diheme c-type cytochrome [Reichenbachiella carrageenanivorans]UXX78928.1 hypothetical protein N7E81_16350 [Reichenbachiella carrageenanivorans]